jgi:hypothetical protein
MSECAAETEPFMGFRAFIRKHRLPLKSAYAWRDQGLFPYFQLGRVILVKESEVLAALAQFKREGKALPYFKAGTGPTPPTYNPGRPKGSKNKTVNP